MTLVQLANFVRIAELQSLSKAAAAIRIAQPALSRQVRQLETELGGPLLVRHAWGVTLTPSGAALLESARRLLKEADGLRDAVHASARNPAGRVALGVPASLSVSLLPPLAEALTAAYPDLRPHFVEGFSANLYARLLSQDLDMAVLYDDRSLGSLARLPLLTERLMRVEAADGGGADAGVLIVPTRPNRLRLIVDEALAQQTATARILEVDSVPAILEMVRNGAGATILPYSCVAAGVRRGELTARPFEPMLTRTLVLAYPREREINPAIAAVRNEIQRLVQDLAETMRWQAAGDA